MVLLYKIYRYGFHSQKEMMFMFCPNCSAKLENNSRFCRFCGARLKNPDPFKIDIDYIKSARDEYEPYKEEQPLPPQRPRKAKRKKHRFARFVLSLISLALIASLAFGVWLISSIKPIDRIELSDDLGISAETEADNKIMNIAVFGLDTRDNDTSGRSDAVLILSVDKKHKAIKLTSLARDSYVEIEGHGKDKLTHAWAFGKADLAVKTINQNFGTNISDYITFNFYQFAEIIDAVGGVEVDVDADELGVMNEHYIPYLNSMGISCDEITAKGVQTLSGGQALAYCRDRYTGGDIKRGERQKEIISALIKKCLATSPFKYPKLINIFTANCTTSLSSGELLSLSSYAVLNKPETASLSIPNKACEAKGKTIKGVWYYVYDTELAKEQISNFIYTDAASGE